MRTVRNDERALNKVRVRRSMGTRVLHVRKFNGVDDTNACSFA